MCFVYSRHLALTDFCIYFHQIYSGSLDLFSNLSDVQSKFDFKKGIPLPFEPNVILQIKV